MPEVVLRIALLHCGPGSGPYAEHDVPADPARFLPEHDWTSLQLTKSSAVRELIDAARAGFDVFVNLCDGAWDEDIPGIEVPQALERLGVAYTGANPRSYDPSRLAMKLACHSIGVATPAFATARSGAEAAGIFDALRPPLIVKHPQGYSSVGMTRASRVDDEPALAREIDRIAAAYGSALVEEFIEGREFTVLVAEPAEPRGDPRTFLPIEVLFPPGETFKHFQLKWIDYGRLHEAPVADAALDAELRAAAAGMFAALGTTGYARVDLRLARDGTLHALEINPNCAVFYPEGAFGSADLVLALDPSGHRGFLQHIIGAALRRRDARATLAEVRPAGRTGFGLFATRPLAAGEIVQRGEEQPVRLVSREHVRRAWSPTERDWFHSYAWPLTDGVHAIWSDDPEEWRPLNHSCNPNTWLRGLDLVTRRPVANGEELTIDYATFTGPELEPFDCTCGSSACRGRIGPADHLDPALAARYGDHVSDYVVRARLAAPASSSAAGR
jgi:D-alanine-D-alanine ligase